MIGSLLLYAGGAVALAGAVVAVTRRRRTGALIALCGVVLAVGALFLPSFDQHARVPAMQLDRFAPVWQFSERHERTIAAPPTRVYAAIKEVRADEILLFRTLTWIRRGGRPLRPGILNAGKAEPLLTVAQRGGFVVLSDDAPREIVIAARILPAVAAYMNFHVDAVPGGSHVVTETRVVARSDAGRRRFAGYWRIIYPGSSLIRRMWLRAIDQRATAPSR